eukprot:8846014-Heterocapsa_arctica.AAC.1
MIFGNLATISRQEEIARKSLIQIINRRDRPEGYQQVWEERLKGCAKLPVQDLINFCTEFEAIGTQRNTDIIQERCE